MNFAKSVSLFGAVGIAAVMTAFGAMAADMSVPYVKSSPIGGPYYNWTGCYIGANAGGIGVNDKFAGNWGAGALAGGQLGCNYQMSQFVIGIDGNGDWSSAKDSSSFTGGNTSATNTFEADVGVRAGIAFDRLLVYGKVGAAWLGYNFNSSFTGPFGTTTTGSATLPGVLIGWGMEYGITPNWTGRVETGFILTNATNVTTNCAGAGCGVPATTLSSQDSQAFYTKIAFSYKF
jgi:outer membrane immunogenic protein